MRLHFKPMSYQCLLLRTLLACLVLMGGLSHLIASLPVAESTSAGGGERPLIRVEEGLVSIKIAGASLEEVLREISIQSRRRLVLDGSRREKISADFQVVPLDRALRRLIKENFLLLYGTDGQLVEVWVLSPGNPLPSSTPVAPESEQRLPLGESESIASLIVDLQRAEERGRAVLSLGELRDERALDPVIGLLEGDKRPGVRQRAIWSLEDLRGPRAITALAAAASRASDDTVRQRAVEALAKIGGHAAIDPLTRALREDPESFVRYEALMNLAEIDGDRVMGPLRQTLDDPEELIRAKAEEILDI